MEKSYLWCIIYIDFLNELQNAEGHTVSHNAMCLTVPSISIMMIELSAAILTSFWIHI